MRRAPHLCNWWQHIACTDAAFRWKSNFVVLTGPGDALPAVLESVYAVGDELRGMGAMEALGCVTSALRAGGGGRGARESVELSEERVRTWAAEEGEDLASDEGRMEVEVRGLRAGARWHDPS